VEVEVSSRQTIDQGDVQMKAQRAPMRMPLKQLTPHPLQAAFYGNDSSEADDKALIEDIKLRGQLSPIIVMPAGNAAGLPAHCMLDGHRRARAMKAAGKTHAFVEVRDDLKDADAATVEAEFLKYNFLRRQLHPLDLARIARRMFELERNRTASSLSYWDRTELRERLGKILGMSGRNLTRYERVLETPKAIQDAVRDGRLKLVPASRVAALPADRQQALAEQITGVADARRVNEIVAAALGSPGDGQRHVTVANAAASFVRQLERGLADLADRVDQVKPGHVGRDAATLKRAELLITALRKLADAWPRRAG
jgi:ParB/RepB/Spo0J family partition protein